MSEGSHNLLLLNKVLVNFFIFLGCVFHPYTQFLVLVFGFGFCAFISYSLFLTWYFVCNFLLREKEKTGQLLGLLCFDSGSLFY